MIKKDDIYYLIKKSSNTYYTTKNIFSTNASDYQIYTLPTSATWWDFKIYNNIFILCGSNNVILISKDGIKWEQPSLPTECPSAGVWKRIACNEQGVVIASDYRTISAKWE